MAFVLITNFTSNTFSTEELPMGMLITADDLSRNDYVAIHSVKKRRSSNRSTRVFPGTEAPGSPVPPGYPLRVLGLSLPFAACCLIEPGGEESGPMVLDLRRVQLCRLSSDFIDAICTFHPPESKEEQ